MSTILGYIWSNGSIYCVEHAGSLKDRGNESGEAGRVLSTDEAHSHVVCDVPGCGIILAKNTEEDEDGSWD